MVFESNDQKGVWSSSLEEHPLLSQENRQESLSPSGLGHV